jgi:GNAT superfamily N-acetyltransferase
MDDVRSSLPAASEHELADGSRVLVRPIVPSDRAQLEAGYRTLSPRSRHTRFFAPPSELSDADLDYLTQLDYRNHCALGAFMLDEPGTPGVAVARYVRDPDDPSSAEVAVTVLDDYQRRGIGTLLTWLLASEAAARGVRTFMHFVQWENDDMIELLREKGARITADEPGVARIEFDLPDIAHDAFERTRASAGGGP